MSVRDHHDWRLKARMLWRLAIESSLLMTQVVGGVFLAAWSIIGQPTHIIISSEDPR